MSPRALRTLGLVALAGFIATIFVANWLVSRYGIVSVGFGLQAPAAVFVVGVAFTLRDAVQRTLGPVLVFVAIIVGALLSLLVSTNFALASGAAFLVSETLDLLVYTPLERRNWVAAVAASNTVGLVADSALFLALAFGSLQFLAGQIVGKAYMTAAAVLVILTARAVLSRRTSPGLAR